MISKFIILLNKHYPEVVKINWKLNRVASDSAEYFLNKYYKEYAFKIEGEFYHGQI